MVDEIYDVMLKVAMSSMTSDSEHVRLQCRQVSHHVTSRGGHVTFDFVGMPSGCAAVYDGLPSGKETEQVPGFSHH